MCQLIESEQFVQQLMNDGLIIPIVAIVFGCSTGIVAIVCTAATKMFVSRGRERTRRELAAYVAEGSISPDQAVAMLGAGTGPRDAIG